MGEAGNRKLEIGKQAYGVYSEPCSDFQLPISHFTKACERLSPERPKSKTLLPWLLSALFLIGGKQLSAQVDLEYYLEQAMAQNPSLKGFTIQQKISGLEIQKIKNQFEKPQWTVTGDYLLAPYFFNNGKAMAITAAPDSRAVGYDAGVTNGGWYAAQANVNYSLFTEKQSRPLVQQEELSQLGMSNQYKLLQAEIKRQVTADYLNAYLLQQQMDYVLQVKNQLAEQQEFIRKLADRGLMRVSDLELISLEIKDQDYQWNNLNIQFRQAIQILNTGAGIVDSAFVRLDTVNLSRTEAPAVSLFLEQYRLDSLAAANNQAVFETRYVPQVDVFANGGVNAVELNNIYRKAGFSAGAHVSWLFGDGGQRGLNAQQNEARQLDAGNQAGFAKRQIQNNRLNNERLLQLYSQNIQLLNGQLANSQALLDTYRKELALGQISLMDYLLVLRAYAGLQQQKAQAGIQLLLIVNEINYWNN